MGSDTGPWQGHAIVPGTGRGIALILGDGLSFALAFDPASGTIRDVHSAAAGVSVVGTVLVMPSGRGSSSSSTALAEAIRLGTAPAAIILGEIDEILAVGAIVARRLYGRRCPVVVLGATDRAQLETGMRLDVDEGAMVRIVGTDRPRPDRVGWT